MLNNKTEEIMKTLLSILVILAILGNVSAFAGRGGGHHSGHGKHHRSI